MVFLVLLGIGVQSLSVSSSLRQVAQIDSLLKEEMEAVRGFRDGTTWQTNGLGTLATGSANPYYAVLNTGTNPAIWTLQTGTETIGEFTRNVVFDKVSRDPSTKNIESIYNASNDDPDTRKITATATWGSKTYQVVTYLTNWQ